MNKIKAITPRICVYTHDTFGLGHIRRCLNIINELAIKMPQSAILLVTGSPALHYLTNLPPNVDIVKIPTIAKTGASGSLPSHLPLGPAQIAHIRSRIIKETVLSFQPDLFLVDNFPLGSNTELLPLLYELKKTATITILGLRDILDCPKVVKAEWRKRGIYDVLDRYYDKIFIYGDKKIFNAAAEYEMPKEVQKKVHFLGYLTRNDNSHISPKAIRSELGIKGPFILATGGGGGDAFPLLETLIKTQKKQSDKTTLIFTGPLMGENDRNKLQALAANCKNIILRDFVTNLPAYMKACDLMVAMCGYNIAAEIINYRPKALVIPRNWRYGEHTKRTNVKKEKEQVMRAKVLQDHGIIHLLEAEDLSIENLGKAINNALKSKKSTSRNLKISGLKNTVEKILELIA